VDAHAYLGHVLSLLGENELAVWHLQQALSLEPDYPLPYYFSGMHYAREGRWITARSYLERAYDLDPTNPALCAAIAETHLRAAEPNYPVAREWLHAAVNHAPDDPRFHLLLAHFYVDYAVDPTRMGVAVAQTAVDLAPESAEAQETLGWARYLAGQPDLALVSLMRARELDPDEPRVHYRLGEVYRALGRPDEARASYQRAIDQDWSGSIGEKARQVMR
jgi:Flp pilus assembly protein TadD